MTTDSNYFELGNDVTGRAYTLVTLGPSGRAKAEEVRVNDE